MFIHEAANEIRSSRKEVEAKYLDSLLFVCFFIFISSLLQRLRIERDVNSLKP